MPYIQLTLYKQKCQNKPCLPLCGRQIFVISAAAEAVFFMFKQVFYRYTRY